MCVLMGGMVLNAQVPPGIALIHLLTIARTSVSRYQSASGGGGAMEWEVCPGRHGICGEISVILPTEGTII